MNGRYPDLTGFALADCLRLLRAPNVGAVSFFSLVMQHGSPEAALSALPSPAPSKKQILAEIERTEALGARYIPYGHADYPALLSHVYDPPPFLIAKGNVHLLKKTPLVALVGSRSASTHGRQLARQIARGLSEAGYVTVSGLARGIDGEVHAASLTGGTIGVSGVGIDQIYPRENADLYARMEESGCIVTEQPIGVGASPRLFPARNRIIAGMSLAVVVVEATLKSGSLITARLGLEAGREIFALPGSPLDGRNQGCHKLIREGAHLAESAQDIIAELASLPMQLREPAPIFFTAPDAGRQVELRQRLDAALGRYPTALDALAQACQCEPTELMAVLTEYELAGIIQRLPGNKIARAAVDAA